MDTSTRFHHIEILLDTLTEIVEEVPQKLVAFVTFFLMQVPESFFTAPASSSGKHHPNFAQGEGGLLRHTLATMEHASRYADFLGLDEYERVLAVVAAMLHDTYKGGTSDEWTHTVSDHGEIAADFIRHYDFAADEGTDEIASAVEVHMGRWSRLPVYLEEMDDLCRCVALADYAASFAGYDLV